MKLLQTSVYWLQSSGQGVPRSSLQKGPGLVCPVLVGGLNKKAHANPKIEGLSQANQQNLKF